MTLPETIEKMKTAHNLLGEYTYELRPVERGYANRTLHINLTDNTFTEKPVTQQMKDLFTGGRGFALKLLWDAVTPQTKWDSPENELVIANGPICGITAYPGSGKATVVTLGPLTENVIDSNVGGYFAPFLKFSGFDALEIQGKAAEDVVIFIDGDAGRVSVETAPLEEVASHLLGSVLTDMYSDGNEKSKRGVAVLSTGRGAEHTRYALVNSTWYDVRRKEVRLKQAGRGGAGRVFRDKKIKGVVVKFSSMSGDKNGVADMALIRKAGARINKEIADLDDVQNQMRNGCDGSLRPAACTQLPLWLASRYAQDRLEGLEGKIHPGTAGRLLAGLYHVLLAWRGSFPASHRTLCWLLRPGRWSRI